jgi:hypothetical protein
MTPAVNLHDGNPSLAQRSSATPSNLRGTTSIPERSQHLATIHRTRVAAGAGDDVIRLSIGLETADDLIRDLDQALGASQAGGSIRVAGIAGTTRQLSGDPCCGRREHTAVFESGIV